MKGQMAMSLLDGLKRKKTKHIREDVWDAPTLFGGVGNDSPNAEKKISVLSAAGGKSARRARQRRTPEKSGPMIRPSYAVLLIGMVVFAGIWQAGVFDRSAAVFLTAKFDALLQAGMSALDPAGEPASERAIRAPSSVATLPAALEPAGQDGGHSGQAALIERVALANDAESLTSSRSIPSQTIPAIGPIEGALNRTEAVVETAQPAAPAWPAVPKAPVTTTSVAIPTAKTSGKSVTTSRRASPVTGASARPAKGRISAEKTTDRNVQMARSKEPDADAQLMEALLVHLRKTESAKGGAR